MNKVYIIWESGGSWEDSYSLVHKVYADEELVKVECDRLNQELKNARRKYSDIIGCNGLSDCDKCDKKVLCSEYYDNQEKIEEQHDYKVEEFEVIE